MKKKKIILGAVVLIVGLQPLPSVAGPPEQESVK